MSLLGCKQPVGTKQLLKKDMDTTEDSYLICSSDDKRVVIMTSVNSVSQMTNSATWFERSCIGDFPEISWTVFLCYDTDAYCSDITMFHEGDWARLRGSIASQASAFIDLAAEADIEDVILCDLPGVLSFLRPPPQTEVPPGNKGKTKLKKLHRMVAVNKTYHSGERAKELIACLDMSVIKRNAPIPLEEIDGAINASGCKI